jgi:hypothetical protein
MNPTKLDSSGNDLTQMPEFIVFFVQKINEYAGLSILSESDTVIEEIREKLAVFLLFQLRHQTERFYAFLYRVDVCEERVRAVVREFITDEKIAFQLACLVTERMKEKFYSRKKYSKS